MKKFVPFFFLLFTLATSFGQVSPAGKRPQSFVVAKPTLAGMSEERLARADAVLQEYISKKWIAGSVALVARHGKIVYYKSFGLKNAESSSRQELDDIFRIASMTKAVTSVAVMMLHEQGLFLLDDPVSRYLPEFKNPTVLETFNERDSSYTTVPAKSEITIRQLLTHTSGLGYGLFMPKLGAIFTKAGIENGPTTANASMKENMKRLAALPLLHHPGERFTYGIGIDVLGYLVEIVSGMSLSDYLQKNLFHPLGMTDTYFYVPDAKKSRLVTLYTEDGDRKIMKAPDVVRNIPIQFPLSDYKTFYSGGAGLISTAMDYAKFLQMLLNNGRFNNVQILSPASVALMTMNQIGTLSLGKNKFGLGFEIVTPEGKAETMASAGKYSWGGAFNTFYWVDPQQDLIAVLMTQVYPTSHGEIGKKFENMIYQAIEE